MDTSLLQLTQKLSKRYAGKYVAVIEGDVIASGKSQLEVYKKAKARISPEKELSILYISNRNASPLLLILK